MYAVVATIDIKPDRIEEATSLLPTEVIPSLQATPGFVRATFLRSPTEPKGASVVLYDSEANAKAAAEAANPPAESPVTFTSILVYEVVADTA